MISACGRAGTRQASPGDDVFGGVDDVEEVDAGLDADLVEDPDQRLDRRVAGAGAEAAAAAVDLLGARPHGLDGVGDAEAEVLVAVEADLRVVAEFGDQRARPGRARPPGSARRRSRRRRRTGSRRRP